MVGFIGGRVVGDEVEGTAVGLGVGRVVGAAELEVVGRMVVGVRVGVAVGANACCLPTATAVLMNLVTSTDPRPVTGSQPLPQ